MSGDASSEQTSTQNSQSSQKTKSRRKKYLFPLVEVYWDDAATAHGWDEAPKTIKPQVALTVGFLVAESEDHLIIASSIDDLGMTNSRIQIPKKMIIRSKLLR